MSKSSLPRWLPVVGAAVLLVALFAWSEGLFAERVGPGDRTPAPVVRWDGPTTTAESRDLPAISQATGTVEPVASAVISARIAGTVEDVLVREGARVTKGDVLVRLSAPELAARSASAHGAVNAADASLQQARRDLARMEALAARDAATQVELERARTSVAVAEADLARLRDAGSAESAMAALTVLRAPFSGLVLERRADPGDLASPGVPLLRLGDDSSFRLEASVDERAAAAVTVGMDATVTIESAGLQATGKVDEVMPSADPASRTQIVKVALPQHPGLRAGLFGRMSLGAGTRRAVVADAAAIKRSGGLTTVRVVGDDGALRLRAVRAGDEVEPGRIEILSGLAGGERLAVEAAP